MAAAVEDLSADVSSTETESVQTPGTTGSAIKNEFQISHWGMTSRDVASLILPYSFSICVALAHFSLFKHLDQKRVGVDTTVPQSWVSSISLILVTTFRISVCLSLGTAFTQHMWRIVRLNPIKVADLDKFFSMQRDALMLFHSKVLRKAPSLYAMTLIGFTIGLAVVFPPGALTVEGKLYQNVRHQSVGVFNASFMGNGSMSDALAWSLVRRDPIMEPDEPKPIVVSTAKMTLIAGELPVLKSPCGPNCTYVITYDGPQVKCHTYRYNETAKALFQDSLRFDTYTNAVPGWQMIYKYDENFHQATDPYPMGLHIDWYSFDESSINMTKANITEFETTSTITYLRSVQGLECIFGYGTYLVNFNFSNGDSTIEFNSTYSGSLADFWRTSYENEHWRKIKDMYLNGTQSFAKIINLQAVMGSLFDSLVGKIVSYQDIDESADGSVHLSESSHLLPLYRERINNSIIMDTVFNTNRFAINGSGWEVEMLDITEHKINQALQNFTIALMLLNTQWSTTTNVTQSIYENTFVFTPTKLIAPYACCLLVVLPFLILGYRSLHLNGVPALSGGFVQTLMTTTGSETLRQAAAAGCLGGQRNIPKELKDLEVIYGELRDEGNGGSVKRATFGTREEIVNLEKGAVYGR